MKRRYVVLALTALAAVLPARSCGPDFPVAIFVNPDGPSDSYASFADGHLGVLQPGYRTRHLVVAYDWMTGRPLTADEQDQAEAVNDHFSQGNADSDSKDASAAGFKDWMAARSQTGFPLDPVTIPDSSHPVPGDSYERFDNCLDDAYATAARTLRARAASYGAKSPDVAEWVHGQDVVFSNCAGVSGLPRPLSAGGLWLRQDRAYQIAAARFYAMDYAGALAGFRAIAANTASPWSTVSRYLEARALIRQATVPDNPISNPVAPAGTNESLNKFTANLTQARVELLAMRSEPRMSSLRGPIDDLLDFVNLRLQPEEQALVLAARLHSPRPRHFGQALIDLTWIRANMYSDNILPLYDPDHRTPNEREKLRAAARASTPSDAVAMLDWMDGIALPVPAADPRSALHHWRATHSTAWLIAALMSAQASDPATPELLEAAAKVPSSDPAFVAASYHRLRLSPPNPATRAEVLALLPGLQKDADVSTVNLFQSLRAATAPSLETWLAAAPRQIAAESSYDQSGAVSDEPDPCSDRKIPPSDRRLFDTDAAVALNTDFPLRLLAEAAAGSALPGNLRFQVEQAAWARAVLLDKPGIAAKMSPLLIGCRAAWKPVLDAYDHATNAEDRRAAGLLALMRFASTEPSVREGEARRNAFASYDEYRQNWWCTTVPAPGGSVDDLPGQPRNELYAKAPAPPTFLTSADLEEAKTEVAVLRKIPLASTYFAQQALVWMKLHPNDPRTADILGEADRVLRNSCRKDPPNDPKTGKPVLDPHDMSLTPNLAHALYDALHEHYPNSIWAKRYTTWE